MTIDRSSAEVRFRLTHAGSKVSGQYPLGSCWSDEQVAGWSRYLVTTE
ncbi:hypothetical protein AB0I53_20440 [Saccharopolyspora sp. NPDC050389]